MSLENQPRRSKVRSKALGAASYPELAAKLYSDNCTLVKKL